MVMKMDSRLNMDTLNQDILNQDSSSLATLASGDVVLLPSADFVTDAALVRHNDDLILTLPDGREFVVEGYFAVDPRPTLSVGEGDMALTPELVSSFIQEIRFEGEGSATAVDGQGAAIGNAETVIGDAFIVRGGERIALEAGEPVFQGDIVETETGGSVKLRFVDETVFSISEDARLALDKMVFDPATSEGESLFSMLKGGFLFISGQIAKTDPSDMQVVTPVATIGIRGTIVTGSVNPGEAFEFSVIDGAIAVQPQGADAPIVMSDAFATLGGTVSETGAISVATRQSSAQEVVERNAGQFATLSDADVSVIESAVLASATENGAAIVLDLQEIVSSVVSQANESGSQASDESDEEPAIIVELEPVAEPEPEPVVLEAQTTVEVLETGLTDSDSGDDSADDDSADDDIGTTVIEEDPGDTEAPAAPVITTSNGATLGRDVAILSGTAEPGSTVTVVGELDGDTGTTETVTTTAAADGSWSVDLGEDEGFAADGETYSYTVTATDAAGNVSEPASIDLALKFTELAAPTLDDPVLTDGYIGDGDDFVLSGTSEDTDTVTVTFTDSAGGEVVYQDVEVTGGTWSLDLGTVTPTSGELDTATGDYQVTVTAADGIGNSAESDPVAIKIDHLDPVLSINEPADTLNIENSTISGTADTDQVTVTLEDTQNNNEIVYKVDVDTDGTWELDLQSAESDSGSHHFLADGIATYSVSVSATDGGGNTSSKSATNSFSADFEAPSVTLDTLPSNGQNTIIEGTSTDPDPVTVTLTGDNNTSVIYTVTPTGDATNGYTWTLDLETATPTSGTLVDDGTVTYDIFVKTEDAAENASNIAIANDVTTDFTAPMVKIDQAGNDTFGGEETTITGTVDTDINEVTVTVTDPNNQGWEYKETVEVVDGKWEFYLSTLTDGPAYDIEVTVKDTVGNEGTAKIEGVTTDFTAPEVTLDPLPDNKAIGSDPSTISGTSSDPDTVTVTLTGSDNTTVVYKVDPVSDNNGGYTWTLDLEDQDPTDESDALNQDGTVTYNISVTTTDAAGNTATTPATASGVTTDFVDPEVTIDQGSNVELSDDSSTISGTATGTDKVTVTVTDNTTTPATNYTKEDVEVTDGKWVLDLKDVGLVDTDGNTTYDISVTASDTAGNEATPAEITGVKPVFTEPGVTIGISGGTSILADDTEIGGGLTNFSVGQTGIGSGQEKVTVTLTGDGKTFTYEAEIEGDDINGYTWVLDLDSDPISPAGETIDKNGETAYKIEVTAQDSAGNGSNTASADNVTTDFVVPEVTLDLPTNANNAIGSGDTVISGTSTDPDTVTVTLDDGITQFVYYVTPTPNTSGSYDWSLNLSDTDPDEPAGQTIDTTGATYDISVDTMDTAGNKAATVTADDVTTDFVAPTVSIVYADGYAIGVNDPLSGDVSGADTVTVVLKDDSGTTFTYNATIVDDQDGTFSWWLDLNDPNVSPTSTDPTGETLDKTGGTAYNVTVTASDAAGNEASVERKGITTDFVDPTIDPITLSDGTTALVNDAVLNTNDMTLKGTSTDAASITVTLTYMDGQDEKTITYISNNQDSSLNGVTLKDDGTWSVDLTSNDDLDKTGATDYKITATATDSAGNTADTTITGVNTDFTAPVVKLETLPGNADNTIIAGTSTDGEEVTVTLDGGNNGDVVYKVTPQSDGNGGYTWSVDLANDQSYSGTLTTDGTASYAITVTTKDAAGNESDPDAAAANATGVTTDFTAPTVELNTLPTNNAIGSDTSTISGTSSDPETVTVTLDDGTNKVIYEVTPTGDATSGYSWTLDLETANPTNASTGTLNTTGTVTYTISVDTMDAAGNPATTVTASGVTTDFTAPVVTLDTADDSELGGTGSSTLSGTSTDPEIVTVTLKDDNNGEVTYTVTPVSDNNGGYTWSVDLANDQPYSGTLTTDGTASYAITVTTKDAAGNESDPDATGANATASGVTTDFEGPEITVNTSGLADISGTVTATGTLGVITGTAEDVAGQLKVTLTSKTDNSEVIYMVDVNDQGVWSLDLNTAIPEGATAPLNEDIGENYTLSVTATDALGNIGASTDQVITINQSASIAYTSLGDGDGDLDNTTPTITGTVEAGSTVSIVIYKVAADGSETIAEEFTSVTVDGSGNFSQTASALTVGEDYRIEIKTTDPAGNTNDVSETVTVTLPKTTLDGSTSTDFSTSATGVYVVDSAANENIILTGAADEVLLTGGGDDTVHAGDGDDVIQIGETSVLGSKATVNAENGDDTIEIQNSNGNFSEINITGGAGKDTITAVSAASATVNIDAGAGDDTLYLTDVSGAVNAGEGDDTIIFDEVSAGLANLALDAGDGDDTVEISHGDFVDLAAGSNNTLSGGNGTDELVITGIASGAAVDASFATGFESIKLMAANSTGSSLSLGLDNTQSLVTPSMTGSADTLVLDGAISGINSITASGGITATIQNSDNAGTGLTVDDITVGDNSHLTLEADAQVTGYGNYDYSVTDLNIGENASLTLQSDKSDTNNGSATDNGTSYLLDVNGTFAMTESSTLNVDLLNLSGNDLINATTVLDLGNTSSADLAGTLNIYANDGIDDTGTSSSQLIANTSGAGGISSTFDEILFLDANGNNLVGTDVENGSDQALIPLYDQYSGLTLNAVSAEEISGGSTYTTNGQADAAFFSNDGTALRTEEANVSLFGSNDQDDTFEVAGSATSIGYYDGGEGGNDTLKLSGDQHIGFHDEYSATGIMDYQVNRIETLDISGSSGYDSTSKLSLSSAMVKAMTEDTNAALAGQLITAENALILKVGQGGIDKIDLSQWGNPGSASGNGTNYTVYEKDGAKLYIDESN